MLEQFLESQDIPHALLLAGPKGGGKKKAAYQFSTSLLATTKSIENHPDIHLYFPEGKMNIYPIETIRKLTQEVFLSPYEAKWKVFILHDAEKMPPTSSNALLKTLEEPPSHTLFILISNHPDRLLPTLLSRCQTLEFPPGPKKEIDPALLALLTNPHKNYELETDDPDTLFETLVLWYRDRLLLELGGCEEHLHFPEHLTHLQNTPYLPLEEVEKRVTQIRLAFERSTKLSTCLEMFFLPYSPTSYI